MSIRPTALTFTARILAALPADCPRPAFIKVHRTKRKLGAYIHAERKLCSQLEGLPQSWIYTDKLTEEQQVTELAKQLAVTIQCHAKSLAERAAKFKSQNDRESAYRAKKAELLRELKLLTVNADGKETVPAFVAVAGMFNVAIESIDVAAGTATLYTQTDVNLRQLVELVRRSSNLSFEGESGL